MIIVPYYYCRNCKKAYPGNKTVLADTSLDKLVPAARYTLGSTDHVFRIVGKTIQLSDLHMCSNYEVGLANFMKIQVEKEEKAENNKRRNTEH